MRETWLTGTTSLPVMLRCVAWMWSVCTSHQCELLSAVLVADVGRPGLVCDLVSCLPYQQTCLVLVKLWSN